jgi:signal transduction histidine kinase
MACVMRRAGVAVGILFGVAVCVLSAACGTPRASGTPSIEFTRIPKAAAGGPLSKLSTIEGRVTGAQPGQRIVLFAKSAAWWIQPFRDQPFTTIRDDSSWANSTHAGTDYAALLVAADYEPPPVVDSLPAPGGGVFAIAVTPGTPPFWQTAWFRAVLVLAGFAAFAALYRFRMHRLTRQLNLRFEERLAERTRIAQELHDTLLQGFVSASMQLHVAADRLPADSPARPALAQVPDLMGRVIEEGRNAVRGLRSPDSEPQDLGRAFSRVHEEFAIAGHADFRMIIEGKPLPLTPVVPNEVYRVGREALVNAFQHAGARHVELQLES